MPIVQRSSHHQASRPSHALPRRKVPIQSSKVPPSNGTGHRSLARSSRAQAFRSMQANFTCSADVFAAIPSGLLPSLATSSPAAHHDVVLQQRPQRPGRTPFGVGLQVRVQHGAGHGPGERAELLLQRDSHPRVPASPSTSRERQSLFPFAIPVTVRQRGEGTQGRIRLRCDLVVKAPRPRQGKSPAESKDRSEGNRNADDRDFDCSEGKIHVENFAQTRGQQRPSK